MGSEHDATRSSPGFHSSHSSFSMSWLTGDRTPAEHHSPLAHANLDESSAISPDSPLFEMRDCATPTLNESECLTPRPTQSQSPLDGWVDLPRDGAVAPSGDGRDAVTPTPDHCITVSGWAVSTKTTFVAAPMHQKSVDALPNIAMSGLWQRRSKRKGAPLPGRVPASFGKPGTAVRSFQRATRPRTSLDPAR
jgi:hypothetical protein